MISSYVTQISGTGAIARVEQIKVLSEFRGRATMEPAITLAAGAIAKLALDEFVKSGAGEAAKQSVGGTVQLARSLWDKITAKFQGNDRATTALAEMEHLKSEAALTKVSKYLDLEMEEDAAFATEIRQIAQQIINIQNQSTTTLTQQNLNYGRDQNIINQPQGDIKIGGGS
ncbi:MAG: hypothetical protein HC772_18675 [Leptolyngbyaceae cyanobacterium CRU_2_3]|nr:hypothetical protein [Leptolyngbyaceae cyanobacterium CRU_2_3]